MDLLARALSHLWPVRVEHTRGLHGPLEVCWENGRLVLNSARANQSFGGLHTVWQRAFRAARLKDRGIGRVLVLGLGAGSILRILRDELGIAAPITAVDDDAEVVRLARMHFGLDRYADLTVIVGDAFAELANLSGPFDLIAVDLFTEQDLPGPLLEPATLDRLDALTARDGLILINTIAHTEAAGERVRMLVDRLGTRFATVRPLKLYGLNVVVQAERRH